MIDYTNNFPLPLGEDLGEGVSKNRLTQLARKLRQDATEAEKILWYHLRAKQLDNLKFRRQQPIGNYIVDFICFEKKLIIEVDGGQHAENYISERKRTKWFHDKEYRIIRFWNNEVLQNCQSVLEEILNCCRQSRFDRINKKL